MSSAPVQIKVGENTTKVEKFDFAYTFRPIYYFSRIFGSLPFTIVFNSKGSVEGTKIRVFDSVWFILSIALYILLSFMRFRSIKPPKHTSLVLLHGDFLLLKSALVFCILFIVMDMCNRFKLVDILKNLITFDEKVSHHQQIQTYQI